MITTAGLFTRRDLARQAVLDLVTSGVPHEDIGIVIAEDASAQPDDFINSLIGSRDMSVPGIGRVVAAGPVAKSGGDLHAALLAAGIPEDQAQHFAEGVRDGRALLVVQSDDARGMIINGVFRRNDATLSSDGRSNSMSDPTPREIAAEEDTPVETDEGIERKAPVSGSLAALAPGAATGAAGGAGDALFDVPPKDDPSNLGS